MKKAVAMALVIVMVCLAAACSGQESAARQGSPPAGDAQETQESSDAVEEDSAQKGAASEAEPAGNTGQEAGASETASAGSTGQEAGVSETASAGSTGKGDSASGNDAAGRGDGFYENVNGWTAWYEPEKFIVREKNEDDVIFLYTGEAVGDNYVEIIFVPDKQPQEVLTAELDRLRGTGK